MTDTKNDAEQPPLPFDEIIRRREMYRSMGQAISTDVTMACRRDAQIPRPYAKASLDDDRRLPASLQDRYAAAVDAVQHAIMSGSTAMLFGGTGSGKTHLACAWLNIFCECGRSAKYLDSDDYVRGVRARWAKSKCEDAFERPYRRARLLAIDNIGLDQSDIAKRLIRKLVLKRHDAGLRTILIGGEFEKPFKTFLGPAVMDRIRGEGAAIRLDWVSLRGLLLSADR